jgi:hypothetical protein
MMSNLLRWGLVFSVVTLTLPAAAAEYFPLAVGNQWIFHAESPLGRQTVVTEILAVEEVGGVPYFIYQDLDGRKVRLRLNEQGQLVVLRTDGGEGLWADFTAERYDVSFEPCTGAATVEARNATFDLGKRTVTNGLAVRYLPAACADAGITRETFLPGVGLAEREVTTIAGPRVYRLTYARVGGVALFGGPEHSFRLSLDRATYPPEFEFNARMTLENSTGQPLQLQFSSGQSFDLVLRDARGNRVYTWSATRLFIAVMREETVDGEKNWTASDRLRLEPGAYVMEAVLTTTGGKTYSASVPLTVTP